MISAKITATKWRSTSQIACSVGPFEQQIYIGNNVLLQEERISRRSLKREATDQDESYCSKRAIPCSTISKHLASHAPLRIWARLPVGAFGASATVRPRSCSSDLTIAPCHGGAAAHVGAKASLQPQSPSLHQYPVQKSDLEECFITSFRFMRSSLVSVVWRYLAFAVIMA